MDSEEKFWIAFWSLLAVVVMTIVITIGVVKNNKNNLIASAKTCEQAVILASEDTSTLHVRIVSCRATRATMN